MFAYEPPLDPPCDEWLHYKLPLLCQERIREVCKDILYRGEGTHYQRIYAAIYELVEEDVEKETIEDEINSYY